MFFDNSVLSGTLIDDSQMTHLIDAKTGEGVWPMLCHETNSTLFVIPFVFHNSNYLIQQLSLIINSINYNV